MGHKSKNRGHAREASSRNQRVMRMLTSTWLPTHTEEYIDPYREAIVAAVLDSLPGGPRQVIARRIMQALRDADVSMQRRNA